MTHEEIHRSHRVGWLRAAVLGANDGIVSTASLVMGVAAASASRESVLLAGLAGLVAGAMSMAAGEYVSVSSQADTEEADLRIERRALREQFDLEKVELAEIYVERGLEPALAAEVADQLMAHDALGAHARDEIGLHPHAKARPVQAAVFSGVTFTVGAALPLGVVWGSPGADALLPVGLASLAFLALLGGLAARTGGAHAGIGAARVTLWGALAMALTVAVGRAFGVVA